MAFEDGSMRARGTEGAGDAGGPTGPAGPAGPAMPGAQPRYSGEGFRHEPEFRDGTGPVSVPAVPAAPAPDNDSTLTLNRKVPPTPNLDYVFDDPADGEPGRDRLLVHGIWEVLLALAVVGVGYLLTQERPNAFGGDSLHGLMLGASGLGVLAVGTALTLRAGAVNLAMGPLAVAASSYYAQHAGTGLLKPMAIAVGAALAVGAVQGLVVAGLHVPGWAAGLGVALAVTVWIGSRDVAVINNGYSPVNDATAWFVGFCVLSVLGGLLGLVPAIRRGVGRFRPVADPADRRGLAAALITFGAIAASAVMAGVAGSLIAAAQGQAGPGLGLDGLSWTGLAVGAALLGGTSAYGRRGGVLGTLLAVALLTITQAYVLETGRHWAPGAFAAAAIGAGLLVTRMVERFGRPQLDGEGDDFTDDWSPSRGGSAATPWTPPREPSWQTTPSSPAATGLWGADDAWNR